MGFASSQGLHTLQDSLINGAGSKGFDQTIIVDTHLLSIDNSSLDVPRVNYYISTTKDKINVSIVIVDSFPAKTHSCLAKRVMVAYC
jgi:hypothetical protein